MATTEIPFLPAPEALAPIQHGLTALRRAQECLFQGMIEITAKQAEVSQKLVLECLSEWQDLSRTRGPEDFYRTEFTLAQEQAERGLAAWRSFSDDIRSCWFRAVDLATEQMKEPATPTKNASRNRA